MLIRLLQTCGGVYLVLGPWFSTNTSLQQKPALPPNEFVLSTHHSSSFCLFLVSLQPYYVSEKAHIQLKMSHFFQDSIQLNPFPDQLSTPPHKHECQVWETSSKEKLWSSFQCTCTCCIKVTGEPQVSSRCSETRPLNSHRAPLCSVKLCMNVKILFSKKSLFSVSKFF